MMICEKILKKIGYKKEITLGDLVQVSLAIVAIVLSVLYISAQIRELKPQDLIELKEGESYIFDDDSLSNITVVVIDTEKKEVKVQFRTKEGIINETFVIGRTRTIPIPQGSTYTFLLKDIKIRQEYKIATFIIRKKGVAK